MMYSVGSSDVSLTTGIVVSVADRPFGRSRLRLVRHHRLKLIGFFTAVNTVKIRILSIDHANILLRVSRKCPLGFLL